jgi:cysteine desulfurase
MGALEELRERGCDVTIVPVDSEGRVEVKAVAAALRSDTALVSVMYANNEIGTVQPIAELAAIAHEGGALFHTDAVQAPGWLPLDVKRLGADLLSLSAHKAGGPKGVGVLYVRSGTPLVAAIPGGGQEFGWRSGTENVAGVAGTAAALEAAVRDSQAVTAKVRELRDGLERGLFEAIPSVRINGSDAERLPAIASLTFPGADAEALLARLDLEGIAVSAGSACTSGALEPSHVIRALGHDGAGEATIRFSLGAATTAGEIDRVLAIVPSAVLALRRTPAQA